tara:strand:+ start:1084 stop:1707 length:624 start_codon:yes stop_codon:yes gene_type:complete
MRIKINDRSFFYQDMAANIAESINSLLKNNTKEYFDYCSWIYDHPIDSEDSFVNWTLKVLRSKEMNAKYDIWGSAGMNEFCEPSIDIAIVLPSKVWQKNVAIKRSELIGTIAHELHHIAQSKANQNTYQKNDSNCQISYFKDPFEIEAFHIGIRAQSIIDDKTFEEVAYSYLSAAGKDIPEKDIFEIISQWKNTDFSIFKSSTKEEK